MATVDTLFPISGTFGNLTLYMINGKCYARTKSSLDRNRFLKDPAFVRSREKAKAFGIASRLAKIIYATLPTAVRKHGLFGKLTAMVHKGLQEGKSKELLVQELQLQFGRMPVKSTKAAKPVVIVAEKQPPQFLSNWQVTRNGQLQFIPAVPLLYELFGGIRSS